MIFFCSWFNASFKTFENIDWSFLSLSIQLQMAEVNVRPELILDNLLTKDDVGREKDWLFIYTPIYDLCFKVIARILTHLIMLINFFFFYQDCFAFNQCLEYIMFHDMYICSLWIVYIKGYFYKSILLWMCWLC